MRPGGRFFCSLRRFKPVRCATGGSGANRRAQERAPEPRASARAIIALALPADWLPDSIDESYVLIHDAVLRALRAVDVPAHRLTCAGRPCGARPAQRWCFAIPGTHDLVTPDGRKLVGSAQRRVRRPEPRVLHHGSLVLRASAVTPFCAAVADHVDPLQAEPELRRLLAAELAAALRAETVPATAAAGA